jgi:hypothetical protein
MPTISASALTGILPVDPSVAASVMNPAPVTAAGSFRRFKKNALYA